MGDLSSDTDQPKTLDAAEAIHDEKTNADSFSGEHGAHPVTVAVGAGTGAAAGASLGAIGGLVGIVAGAAAGGIAGGIVGKMAGEALNPTVEDSYWRENFLTRSYFVAGRTYDYYEPAYRHGWTGYLKYADKEWLDIEPLLESEWQSTMPLVEWKEAKPATQDAFERLVRARRT